MKNKKVIIFVIIISVYALISLFIVNNFFDDNRNNNSSSNVIPENKPNNNNGNSTSSNGETEKKDYKYLLIENTDIWAYFNNMWSSKEELDVTDKKLSVIINNQYFGDYYLKSVNNWNLIDDDNKFVNYNGNFLAHSEDFSINVKEYTMGTISLEDLSEIYNILGFDISILSLTTNEKLVMDLDSNGINDSIINVSNLDSEFEETYFNLIYVVINGKTNIILKNIIEIENILEEPTYNIQYVLNIDKEEYDSIILQKRYFSNVGETNSILYKFMDNEYKIAID